MQDQVVKLYGNWKYELRGPDNAVKKVIYGPNVVCTNGKEFLASFLYSAAAAASTFTMRYIAIGTDSTTEAAANTALGAEAARVSGIVSYVSNQIFQVTGTFGAGVGTGSIVEYGLFSTATTGGGTMLARDTEAVITKGSGDTLTVTAQFSIS